MPRSIKDLLSDASASAPRYVRLHHNDFSYKQLLDEISVMAVEIVRRISQAQMVSQDQRAWPIREVANKWDSIKAYPEMIQDADVELLKILVLDAYADYDRLRGGCIFGDEHRTYSEAV